MNPTLTSNLLNTGKSIENNALSSPVGSDDGLSGELFAEEFSSAMEDILPPDGKFKPSDFAAIKGLEIQDLTELQGLTGIELPSHSTALKQASILSMLTSEDATQIENIDLFGNPDANALLKTTNLISEDLLKEGILNKGFNKSNLHAGKVITTDLLQQSIDKKNINVSNILDDINFSQYMKDLGKSDIDSDSLLLTQVGRQEINTVKLADQLASLDKTFNPITVSNSNSIKSYTSGEQSGAMLHRIEVPVAQNGWGDAVGNRLMMMVSGKMQSANIHLNPAELGPIEIRVSVNQEHATVHFVSSNAVVREAIEDAFPRLKEMFMQNGLSLTDANVSQDSSFQHGHSYSNEQTESLTGINDAIPDVNVEQTEIKTNSLLSLGMVDQYV